MRSITVGSENFNFWNIVIVSLAPVTTTVCGKNVLETVHIERQIQRPQKTAEVTRPEVTYLHIRHKPGHSNVLALEMVLRGNMSLENLKLDLTIEA